jgi:hypothetical protein
MTYFKDWRGWHHMSKVFDMPCDSCGRRGDGWCGFLTHWDRDAYYGQSWITCTDCDSTNAYGSTTQIFPAIEIDTGMVRIEEDE